jgi:arylsulfatase A-like enzyme
LGRDVLGLAPNEPTLASVAKQAGYATAAFNAANPYISARFGYGHGFDTFRDYMEGEIEPPPAANAEAGSGWASRLNRGLQKIRPAMGPLRQAYDELYFRYCQRATPLAASLGGLRRFPAADVIVDDACRWLASAGDSPFFLWLHLMDPHSPYYPKEEALAMLGNDTVTPAEARYRNSYWNRSDLGAGRLASRRDDIVDLYDAGVRWVDEQVARLIQGLQRLNRWDDSLFALTADHGEEFLDHGGRYHPPNDLMEELIHVPLLMRVPGGAQRKVDAPFSLIHLAPTLLDAAQLPVPQEFQGRSYLSESADAAASQRIAISECVAGCTNPFRADKRTGSRILSVRGERFKLVVKFDPLSVDLYDLLSDPGEQSPLAPGAQKPMRERLLKAAYRHIRQSIEHRPWQQRAEARLSELRLEWKTPANNVAPVTP